MKISREDVLRVAELAHLELSAQEVETFREQLDEVLSYVDKLNELDVTNVEAMAQVLFASRAEGANSTHSELREDTVERCDAADSILPQAPDATKAFFRVPKVIDR